MHVVPETQEPLPAQPCPPHWAYFGKVPPTGAAGGVGASGAGNVTNVVCGSLGVPGSCGAGCSSVGVPPSAGLPRGRAFSPVILYQHITWYNGH